MHYFKRNIGDYHKKAGRLSILEHGAYTLLLDACYDRERFPTLDEAVEWCWARTADEIAAVEFVLKKFFTLVDGIYVQARVQEEIDAYHAKAEKNKEIALAREATRKANRERFDNETSPDEHETCTSGHLTINQEPRTNNQDIPAANGDGTVREISEKPKAKRTAKSEKLSFTSFIEACRALGEQAIPADDPVFDYASRVGIPDEFVALAWGWFKRRYADKTQTGVRGWRQAFRNAVEGSWPRYWYPSDDGSWQLTTAGKQAQIDMQAQQKHGRAAA